VNHDKPPIEPVLRSAVPPDLCDKDGAYYFETNHTEVASRSRMRSEMNHRIVHCLKMFGEEITNETQSVS
jgi:hypothetical protein